jgi:anti-sigma B factor antagonist
MTPHEIDLPAPALSVRDQDGYTITAISGDLDIARVPAVREQLLGILGPHLSRIVVDLAGVTFCDASGLAVLIGASRRAWLLGGVLRLAAPPPPPVTAVLRLTGLDLQLEIFATVPAAISAPARPSWERACTGTRRAAGSAHYQPTPRNRCGGRQPRMMTTCMRLSPPCSLTRTRGLTPTLTADYPSPARAGPRARLR